MMKRESLDCLDIIESVWTHVLLNWLNKCLRPEEKLKDLNIEILGGVTEKYNDDVFEGNRAVQNTYFLQNFMQVQYPQLRLRDLSEESNPGLKCYVMTSVLLYYCCIESKSGAVDNDICKNLDKMEQEIIVRFCEGLMGVDVTVDNVLNCIEDAYNKMHHAMKTKTTKVYRSRSRSLDSLPSTIYRSPSVRLMTSSDDTTTTLVPDDKDLVTSSITMAPSTYYYMKPRVEQGGSFRSFDDDIPKRCYIHSESGPRQCHSSSQSEYCIRSEIKIKERDTAVQKNKHTSGYVVHYPRRTKRIPVPKPFVLKVNRSVDTMSRSKHKNITFAPKEAEPVEPKGSDYRFDFSQPCPYRKRGGRSDESISGDRCGVAPDKNIPKYLKRDFSMETDYSDIPKDAETNTAGKEEKKEVVSRTDDAKKKGGAIVGDKFIPVDKPTSEHLRRDFSMETDWSGIPKDAETSTPGKEEKKGILKKDASFLGDKTIPVNTSFEDFSSETDFSDTRDAQTSITGKEMNKEIITRAYERKFILPQHRSTTIQVQNMVNITETDEKKNFSRSNSEIIETEIKVMEDEDTRDEKNEKQTEPMTTQKPKTSSKHALENLKSTLKTTRVFKKGTSTKNVLRNMLKATPGGSKMSTMSKFGLEYVNRQKLTPKAFRKQMLTPECSKKVARSDGDGFRSIKNKFKASPLADRRHNLTTVLTANSQGALQKSSSPSRDLRKLREKLAMSPDTAKKLKYIIDSSDTDFRSLKSKMTSRVYLKDEIKSLQTMAKRSGFGKIPRYRASETGDKTAYRHNLVKTDEINSGFVVHSSSSSRATGSDVPHDEQSIMDTDLIVPLQDIEVITDISMGNMIHTETEAAVHTESKSIVTDPKKTADSELTDTAASAIIKKVISEENRERCANSTSCSLAMNYIKTSDNLEAIDRSCDKCFPEEPSSRNKSGIFGKETKFVGLFEPLYFMQPRRIALSVNNWFGEWTGWIKIISCSSLVVIVFTIFMFELASSKHEILDAVKSFKMTRDDTIKVYNTHNHFSSYWQCQNGVCKKIANNDDENIQNLHRSYGVCSLRCMEPHLWPQPVGYVSYTDKNIVSITTKMIGYKLKTLSNEVSEYLHEAFRFFSNDLLRIENSYPKPENDVFKIDEAAKKVVIDIVVTADKDPRLRLDTVESYKLKIEVSDSVQISITADSFCGARHGLETLSQLIVLDQYSGLLVLYSGVSIADTPVNRYRGLMLDTARNFIPVPDIIRTVDAMAACKLNTFHWRISDAASFPLKLDKLPQLVEYGAYDISMIYNQTDVQKVVDRAAFRGIRVLIEVAAPGPVGRAWAWSDDVVCSERKSEKISCENKVCTKIEITDSNLYILQQIYSEIIAMTKVNDVIHLSNGLFSPLPCRGSLDDRGRFLDKVLERLKLANKGFMPKLPIIWFTKHLMNESEASSWDKLGVQLHEFVKESTENVLSKFRLVHSAKWDLSCKMKNNWCHKFKTWQEMYNWHSWRNIRGLTTEGGEAMLWTDLVNGESLDLHVWPRTAAVAERLWSDINVNATVDPSVYLRLESHRWRMELRGINGRPIWPLWCTFDPIPCLQKVRSLR